MPGRILARIQSDWIDGPTVAEDDSASVKHSPATDSVTTNGRETDAGRSDAPHVISTLLQRRARDILERFRRSQAIGAAPSLIAYAILQLQLTPSMEAAADFAADRTGGRLGASLRRHRLAEPTGRGAFEAFAAAWYDRDPSLQRAVSLMGTSVDAPPDSRDRILERALDTALTGARDRVSTFATDVRGPAMGMYAFGVMLPLSLVGMLPVVSSTGGSVSIVLLAAVYDVILPVFLLAGAAWLAVKRPAVAAPSFRLNHLEFERPLWQSVGVAVLIGAVVTVGAPLVVPAWSGVIVAVGTGIGSFLIIVLSPLRETQAEIAAIEAELPAALEVAGQRLAEGAPIESAISAVGKRLHGSIAEAFARAAHIQSRLGVEVESAFFGHPGALDRRSSRRIETTVSLLLAAAKRGPPGGETVVELGTYLGSLDSVEREARRDLAQTTNTLRQTALVFAPAIAGATVALATGMNGVDAPGSAIDVPVLGQVIGVYVLVLAVILPVLSVALERGYAPIRMGYRAGIALTTGSVLYPMTFLAARTLVYV